jgi:hypothetical protein
MPPLTAKKFFNKIGSGAEKGLTEFTKSVGKASGAVIGSGIAKYAMEAAPALLAFKNGGKVPGKKGKAMKAIVHGGEVILPLNAPATKKQLAIIKRNKQVELMKSGKLS